MICEKCRKGFSNSNWKSGVTFEGIDRHHNPPEFISNRLGEEWSGEFYNLCRKCHREIHTEILIILNVKSNALKFINSEHWICERMNTKQIEEAKEEIYLFTKEWIMKKEDEGDARNK